MDPSDLRMKLLAGCAAFLILGSRLVKPSEDAAYSHHQRGVNFHLKRCLDEASREYGATLDLDPPKDPSARQMRLAQRFLPRIFVTSSEPFKLQDFAVILHPTQRWIAYHFFWEDDIDFPEDNDPCDHEVMWVEFAEDEKAVTGLFAYFHGRLLRGGREALQDANAHSGRPRVNVQWGKHGSLLLGWEEMEIIADQGDAEKKYYPLNRRITLLDYNRGTFEKLSKEGRRLADHPLGKRWPSRFTGTWQDFTKFAKPVDPSLLLNSRKMVKVSRWNSATINQHFLRYNFRPKTEWPTAPTNGTRVQ
jgi:hypothetical protein